MWPATLEDGARRLKRYFSGKQVSDIKAKFATIGRRTDRLMVQFTSFAFANDEAREYACHGFARRIQILRRCVQNVFKIVPPGTTKVPARERLHDAAINLQAFVANAYGCVDNLAWVWVHEKGLAKEIEARQVGLRSHNTRVRRSLPLEFREYLEKLDDGWFPYIAEYRHALAHRIPLYIPPGGVRPKDVEAFNALTQRMSEALNNWRSAEFERLSVEQNRLLIFQPLMTHSIRETRAHFAFHAQLIADFLTVEELGWKMLAELRRK
jgi:hypothetical protein